MTPLVRIDFASLVLPAFVASSSATVREVSLDGEGIRPNTYLVQDISIIITSATLKGYKGIELIWSMDKGSSRFGGKFYHWYTVASNVYNLEGNLPPRQMGYGLNGLRNAQLTETPGVISAYVFVPGIIR